MQGWRKSQEDAHIAHFIGADVAIFGVFDGHGGKEVSLFVKDVFCEEIQKLPEFKRQDYGAALKENFKRMDELLLTEEGNNKLKEIQQKCGTPDPFSQITEGQSIASFTGCTATVVLISKDHIYCANAGDSRTVLGRSKGQKMCEPLSDDHKPENPGERARIEAAGGFVEENRVNGSLNLSRSMGDFEYKSKKELKYNEQQVIVDPEIKKVARQANDQFIMMACDGIWDCVTSEEGIQQMREALGKRRQTEPISSCIEGLFDRIIATDILASQGVGTDNMTCILVEFKR